MFALFGIFVAGGVTGTFVTLRFGREWVVKRPGPDQWAPNHLRRLTERLDLRPDQQEQLRPIVRRNIEELSRLRNDCISATKTVFERMEREISEKLSPEQRIQYDKLNREMRERARKFVPERKRPPGKDGAPHDESGKPQTAPSSAEKPASGI